MTMGPAPMIRIEEMSVRLGIKSRAQGLAHARYAPPGQICRLSRPFRDGVEGAQAVGWSGVELPGNLASADSRFSIHEPHELHEREPCTASQRSPDRARGRGRSTFAGYPRWSRSCGSCGSWTNILPRPSRRSPKQNGPVRTPAHRCGLAGFHPRKSVSLRPGAGPPRTCRCADPSRAHR
jgi:hypothetical protein